ncbi:hypothetical protein GOODEAATRI_027433, partial [Goodea atripinnis]
SDRMIRSVLICWVLFIASSGGKPTERKTKVHQEDPLSQLQHDDDKNFDYDHEAFLGQDEAKTFDQLSPDESKRRLSIIVDKIDSNKDDFVSEEELKLWIKNVQNRHMFENVEHQWNEFDLNKDGLISWEEYRNVTYGSYLDNGAEEPEWVATERQQFSEFRDKNKDGKMDREETLDWILPADYDHAIAEAKHLLYESDTNKVGLEFHWSQHLDWFPI